MGIGMALCASSCHSTLDDHIGHHNFWKYTVLITPPHIATGLWDSSRIPTGILLDFNKISKKAFSHIFSFPSYWGLLLDSYWTPTGLLLDSYWTPTGLQLNLNNVNAMLQTLDSYWIPTGLLHTWQLCAVLYPPPQIPHGLHMDSINPPGLHLDSILKRPQATILLKIHVESTWTPHGVDP